MLWHRRRALTLSSPWWKCDGSGYVAKGADARRRDVGDAVLEFFGLVAQIGVGELLHRRLERVDRLQVRFADAFQLAVVVGAEDLGENGVDHGLDMRVVTTLMGERTGGRSADPGHSAKAKAAARRAHHGTT